MHAKYNYIILIGVLLIPITILLFGPNQAYTGDLTRVGGYLESDYYPQTPQHELNEQYYSVSHEPGEYDKYYDVVIAGDSFSISNPKSTWVNFFAKITGLSAIVIPVDEVEDFIQSKQFRNDPPLLFLYESVEREVISRLNKLDSALQVPEGIKFNSRTGNNKKLSFAENAFSLKRVNPGKDFDSFEQKISETLDYFNKMALRTVGINSTKAVRLYLAHTNKSLFSSVNQDSILLYKNDFYDNISSHDASKARKSISKLQHAVEKNRKAMFNIMIFPDKLSAYAAYLTKPLRNKSNSIAALLLEDSKFSRVDLLIDKMIADGNIDVYLPNDTHTSSPTNRAVAEYIIKVISGS